jgi:glycosyltransferase involved in cell wall biosynthesis
LKALAGLPMRISNVLRNAHPEHHFFFLFDRDYHEDFIFSDNITPIVIFPPARHPLLYHIWFQYSVPRFLKKINADLFISTDGYMPLNLNIKTFNVFHDLNFEHYPKDVPWLERWYYRKYFPKFAWKADRLATVSEYSKNDIINLYGISANKVEVVYNGANEIFAPLKSDNNTRSKK